MKVRNDKHSYGSGYFDGTLEEGHRWKAKVEALEKQVADLEGQLARARRSAKSRDRRRVGWVLTGKARRLLAAQGGQP